MDLPAETIQVSRWIRVVLFRLSSATAIRRRSARLLWLPWRMNRAWWRLAETTSRQRPRPARRLWAGPARADGEQCAGGGCGCERGGKRKQGEGGEGGRNQRKGPPGGRPRQLFAKLKATY